MTPPEPPPGSAEPKKLWSSGQDLARAALAELSSGADQWRAAGLASPPRTARVRSFVHGFLLPFLIARRLWRTREERRGYLRVVLWQLAVTVALCLGLALLSSEWREDLDPPEQLRARAEILREEARRLTGLAAAEDAVLAPYAAQQVLAAAQEEANDARPEAIRQSQLWQEVTRRAEEAQRLAEAARGTAREAETAEQAAELKQEAAQAETEAREALEVAKRAEAQVLALSRELGMTPAEVGPVQPPTPTVRIGGGPDGKGLAIRVGDEEGSTSEGEGPEPVEGLAREVAGQEREELFEEETAPGRLELLRSALTQAAERRQRRADEAEQRAEEIDKAGGLLIHRTLLFWASVFSVLYVVQTLVIWMSREFHDLIETRASRLIGMPPEEIVDRPRVRVNLRWMRKKLKRRWRALFVFGTGLPLIYLISIPFPGWLGMSSILSALWFSYWWVVWSAGRTSYAWTEPPADPWYLRLWDRLSRPLGFLRWYGRTWRRFTQSVFAPATCFEQQPWSMAGLGLARAVGSIPVIKIFLRPFFPVASALLIEERRGRMFTSTDAVEPVIPAEPVEPPGEAAKDETDEGLESPLS